VLSVLATGVLLVFCRSLLKPLFTLRQELVLLIPRFWIFSGRFAQRVSLPVHP
jgi:hypothetical protein